MTARAIERYMAQRRAAWRDDGRRAGDFPGFSAGQTITSEYVRQFCGASGCSHIDMAALGDRPAAALQSAPPSAQQTNLDTL